jgi:hypothetical protein
MSILGIAGVAEDQYLGGKELRSGQRVGVVRRDVDVPIYIVFGDGFSDALGTLNMNVLEREVPACRLSQCRPAVSLGALGQAYFVG